MKKRYIAPISLAIFTLLTVGFYSFDSTILAAFNHADSKMTPLLSSSTSPVAQTYSLAADTVELFQKMTPEAMASEVIPGKPTWLTIPSINVDAAVEHIGLTKDGAVGVPEGVVNVSWFSAGPRPGQIGSAVISGHSGIWRNNNTAVFDRLPNVKPGNSIYVKDVNGVTRTFIVQEIKTYGKNDVVPEIFNQSDKVRLNIITCYGTYLPAEKTYDKRLVVFAVMK